MNKVQIQETLQSLLEDSGGFSLPGLDFDSIVNNLVEKRHGSFLNELSPLERQNKEKEIIEYYNTTASNEINSNIAKIKKSYSLINNQIVTLQESIVGVTASNAIPSVITTGSAASVPNPAYALLENKQKVGTLKSLIETTSSSFVELLDSSLKIDFELPDSILTLIETFKTLKQSLSNIPI